jgi:hypothetical protein
MHAHQARGIDSVSVRRARSGATKAQASEMMERHGGIPGDSIRDLTRPAAVWLLEWDLGAGGPGQHLFCGRRAEP